MATPTSAFGSSATDVSVETAVANAVAAAEANTPVPSDTTPSLSTASTDHVDLGDCDAYQSSSWHVCQYGDATGSKSVVVIGNSHASMWVPAISLAAKADGWKFYPVVHEACGFQQFVNLKQMYGSHNLCAVWYDKALTIIKRLHPNTIIVGSLTGKVEADDPYSWQWAQGEEIAINALKKLTKRVIVLSDTTSIPSPAGCLLVSNATQGSCLWPIVPMRAAYTALTSKVATSTGSQFIDVTPWFCDDNLCPSLINNIVPLFDGSHVSADYSTYLGTAMEAALNLNGKEVVAPQSVPVPVTTTTTSTTTTTLPTVTTTE